MPQDPRKTLTLAYKYHFNINPKLPLNEILISIKQPPLIFFSPNQINKKKTKNEYPSDPIHYSTWGSGLGFLFLRPSSVQSSMLTSPSASSGPRLLHTSPGEPMTAHHCNVHRHLLHLSDKNHGRTHCLNRHLLLLPKWDPDDTAIFVFNKNTTAFPVPIIVKNRDETLTK